MRKKNKVTRHLNTKIKQSIKTLVDKVKGPVSTVLSALLFVASISYLSVKAPELHNAYLRYKVGSKVYMIKGHMKGGGGTGFAIKAPSGKSYIVTNSHVCEGALTQSNDKTSLLVVGEESVTRRKIIENSDFTDLCLLEGIPDVEGLSIGTEPTLGEIEAIVGHPLLRPLSISKGEIVGAMDVYIPVGYATTEEEIKKCSERKNSIQDVDLGFIVVRACFNVTKDAYMSTIIIYPGNSGSPVVSSTGSVVGVAFASDHTNWAYIVSLKDLKEFLKTY